MADFQSEIKHFEQSPDFIHHLTLTCCSVSKQLCYLCRIIWRRWVYTPPALGSEQDIRPTCWLMHLLIVVQTPPTLWRVNSAESLPPVAFIRWMVEIWLDYWWVFIWAITDRVGESFSGYAIYKSPDKAVGNWRFKPKYRSAGSWEVQVTFILTQRRALHITESHQN